MVGSGSGGRSWTLGRRFVLRHAGFPFDWLEALGYSEAVEAELSKVLAAEDALEAALAARGRAAELETITAGRTAKALDEPSAAALARWKGAVEALTALTQAERGPLRAALHRRACEEKVQEAIFLSSPGMYENVWSRYVASREQPDNADGRRVERQVYTYLQRLCAKNETTSFFGPMGYGELAQGDAQGVEVRSAGPQRRRTFFAFWAVGELARAVGREKELRNHLPVRQNPLFDVTEAGAACPPLGLEVALTPQLHQLLAALKERKTFAGAAAELKLTPEATERLAVPLLKCAFLLRGLPFEPNDFGTFESLQAAVAALPDLPAKARWQEQLAGLWAQLQRFQGAPLAQRRTLLPELEKRFTELTGQEARRGEGQVYSDRFILYEEASSPFYVSIGGALARRMEGALSGGLELSAAFGQKVQRDRAAQVTAKLGSAPERLDLLSYAVRTRPDEVGGSRFSPVPPVEVALAPGQAGAEQALPASLCGESESGGRYALPDVCLSRRGEGAFDVVLARVHHHLLLYSWLCAFHPDRAAHESVASSWLAREPSAKNVVSLAIRRRNKGFYRFPGRTLIYAVTDALDVEQTALTGRQVEVRRGAHGPELYGPDGQRLFLYLALDDFSSYPPFAALAHPQVLHAPLKVAGERSPRFRISAGAAQDGAVYQRARWQLPTAGLEKASGALLLLAVARARRKGGWGRFVFVRSPVERKPYLIDMRSPFALELLKHMARGAEAVTVEEMLPAPGELWLEDERGRYTCELRMQAERWS